MAVERYAHAMGTFDFTLTWLLPWRARREILSLEESLAVLRRQFKGAIEERDKAIEGKRLAEASQRGTEKKLNGLVMWVRVAHRLDLDLSSPESIKQLLQKQHSP